MEPEICPGPVDGVLGDHAELGPVLQILPQAEAVPVLPGHVVELGGVHAGQLLGGLGLVLAVRVGELLLLQAVQVVGLDGAGADDLVIVNNLYEKHVTIYKPEHHWCRASSLGFV